MEQLKIGLLVMVHMALVACGGGGGGQVVNSTPAALPASAGTGAGTTAIQGHFDRLNEVRQAMGLNPLAWSDSLAAAAQGHADFQRVNQLQAHGQVPGMQGFTATGYGDRARLAGFTGSLVGEVIVGGNAQTAADGSALMDALLTAPGHRFVLLGMEFTDAGIGALPLTTNVGQRGTPWVAPDRVVAYPYNGQTGVPTAFAPASESPNPLPDVALTGMPLSVHAGMFASFVANSIQLTNNRTGADVALLPAETLGQNRGAFVFFPRERLEAGTSYTFRVDLVIAGKTRTVTSTFTTGSN
ncbi:MAG: CAP domain-containing protein [Pseudomonadota bacterium]